MLRVLVFFSQIIPSTTLAVTNSYSMEAEGLLKLALLLKKCTSNSRISHWLKSSQTAASILTKYEATSLAN